MVHIAWKPGPPRQTALLLVMGSFPPYHHVSWALFFWTSLFFFFSPPISIQLQIMATPRVWMHSGSRELQQPKHVFPFRWGVAGFLPEQTGLKLSHDFCECGQGRKEGKKKKKKSTIIQGHLLFQYIQDKKKRKQFKNRMYLHSRLSLSPAPLHCCLFPFTIRNCIEFVFQSEN